MVFLPSIGVCDLREAVGIGRHPIVVQIVRAAAGGEPIRPLAHPVVRFRDESPTAVGVGDLIEAEKLPRTPPNPRRCVVVRYRLRPTSTLFADAA
jgi:hypothetical protein